MLSAKPSRMTASDGAVYEELVQSILNGTESFTIFAIFGAFLREQVVDKDVVALAPVGYL